MSLLNLFTKKNIFSTIIIGGMLLTAHLAQAECRNDKFVFNNLAFENDGTVDFNRTTWVAGKEMLGAFKMVMPGQWNARLVIESADVSPEELANASQKTTISGKIRIDLSDEKDVIFGTFSIGPDTTTPKGNVTYSWSRLLKFQMDSRFEVAHSYECDRRVGLLGYYDETRSSGITIIDRKMETRHVLREVKTYYVKDIVVLDDYEEKLLSEDFYYQVEAK